MLAGGFGGFADGVLGLALAADEQDFFALADEVGEEVGGLVELLDGFFQVDDVDAAFVLHQEGLHARVPFLGLVAVVDAGVHHFVDEFVDHGMCGFPALIQDGRCLKTRRVWNSPGSSLVRGRRKRGAGIRGIPAAWQDLICKKRGDLELLHGSHPRWPELDVDLDLLSLENPSAYPLVFSDTA